jgi:hypothetical protein
MTNLSLLPDDIRSEFSVNDQGQAFASRRAIARLAGVSHVSIGNLLDKIAVNLDLPESIEILGGQDFEGVNLIPDTVASRIIEYYAFDAKRYCTEQAKRVYKAFGAIGFRSWVQTELGWQYSQPKLPQTYAEALLEAGRLALEVEKLEAEKTLLEQENGELSKNLDELFDYSSIVRIAKFNQISEKIFNWRLLKALSLKMGLEIKKVPCPRFETKSLYSHDVWRVAYPEMKLPETTTLVINRG